MGFPTWTLWGMGLSATSALIAVGLAYLAQSPRLISRLNLTGQRLDLRARSLTGYGFALLLLTFGFFMAGVPLTEADRAANGLTNGEPEVLVEPDELAVAGTIDAAATITVTVQTGSGAMVGLGTRSPGSTTGAMDGLATPELAAADILTDTESINIPPSADLEVTPGEGTVVPTNPPTETPTTTPTNTPIPTATPTVTPSPTLTPTPIFEPTARVNDNTSTLPLRQLPGGQVLVVLVRGDTVILHNGRAFHTGQTWQEISTVDGVMGWVPDRFLDYSDVGG
ncbi:MAG: SH3 domain-containing protein [Chloroflexota bacterium]|jgi:hypothetical protein